MYATYITMQLQVLLTILCITYSSKQYDYLFNYDTNTYTSYNIVQLLISLTSIVFFL